MDWTEKDKNVKENQWKEMRKDEGLCQSGRRIENGGVEEENKIEKKLELKPKKTERRERKGRRKNKRKIEFRLGMKGVDEGEREGKNK